MEDLQCVFCGGAIDQFVCAGCGHKFSKVFDLPFIGAYQSDDILGLIEIAANIPNRDRLRLDPSFVESLDTVCEEYFNSEDKPAFLARIHDVHGSYFLNRYAEWEEVNTLTSDLDLAGKAVLDVGAGLGYDSYRLSLKGANVTALEFSPILMEAGAASFPNIRWIGGLAHALPFKDASFDAVFFNAALHHMRDLRTVIFEALRVLRPGGMLITTCDSFRPDHDPATRELKIFDDNEAVLLGVNEQVPCFCEFTDTLFQHPQCVEAELFTHMVHGGIDGRGEDLATFRKWELRDADMLRRRSGALAMRVRKLNALPGERAKITSFALLADQYAELLTDQAKAISSLSAFMPEKYVNRGLSAAHTKFDLLNGWRMPQFGAGYRRVFKRGRRFFRRRFSKQIKIRIRSNSPATFAVVVDGRKVQGFETGTTWQNVVVDITSIPAGKAFAIEIQRETPARDFNDGHFDVAKLAMSNPLDRLPAGVFG